MYIMDIKIGSYTIRGEILLLIVIMTWILFGHLFFSCTRIGVEEGFEIAKQLVGVVSPQSNNLAYTSQFSEYKSVWDVPSPPRTSVSPADNLAVNNLSDVNTPFNNPPLAVKTDYEKPYQLPPGKMDILSDTKFKPECCPNLYSTGEGCACFTDDQFTFMKQRGGNNVPISDY